MSVSIKSTQCPPTISTSTYTWGRKLVRHTDRLTDTVLLLDSNGVYPYDNRQTYGIQLIHVLVLVWVGLFSSGELPINKGIELESFPLQDLTIIATSEDQDWNFAG